MRIYLLLGSLIMLMISSGYAQIYKWTDDSGKLHFSDQPHGQDNEEKVGVSSYNTMKEPDADYVIGRDMNDLSHKIEEINREAKSCYYHATTQKIFDISCKNFETLLNRDIKPLTQKITDFIRSKPNIKNIDEIKQKFDQIMDVAKEADENYKAAVKYLLYITENH